MRSKVGRGVEATMCSKQLGRGSHDGPSTNGPLWTTDAKYRRVNHDRPLVTLPRVDTGGDSASILTHMDIICDNPLVSFGLLDATISAAYVSSEWLARCTCE